MVVILRPMKKLWTIFLLFSLAPLSRGDRPFKVLVPKGTVLSRLSDGQKLTLPRDLYTNILKGEDDKNEVYVLNKKGKELYSVPFKKIIFIDQVGDLFKQPVYYQEYPPQKKEKKDSLNFFQDISFILYQLTPKFLVPFESNNIENISGQGLQYNIYFDFDFPIFFGGEFYYLLGTTDSLHHQIKIQQSSIGPIINIPLTPLHERKVFLQIGTLFSTLFHVKSSRNHQKYRFHSQSIKIGLQSSFPSSLIHLIFGIHFSQQFIRPLKNQLPDRPPYKTTKENQLSFLMGVTW